MTTLAAGIPAMTMRQVRLEIADENQGRHWPHARCWCGAGHDGTEAGLAFTAPPWDVTRDEERAG